ncbi:tetratricopeptide repeat protein [Streptomyces sp. NPDC087437]|uniref:tetratricopeptide repeat protein n=1 Tax=Streptomyces sp. NPDC087437 TaxID=3365789 RepID=UPI00380D9FEE
MPKFEWLRRSTLYSYLAESDDPVATDWEVVANLLRCIDHLALQNSRPVDIDYRSWEGSWERLRDARRSGRRRYTQLEPRLTSDNWIGGWDGAADAVLTHSSAREFTVWPPGHEWLDSLAQSVAQLSAASQPEIAKEAAERLVVGAAAEFGETDPKSLAARHALAFWTGQSGHIQRALELTSHLRADCQEYLGEKHILSRLAVLREAWWTGHMGRWREANRLYIEAVRAEAARPDRDQAVWLLARWGMARTGGRSGNWMHAHAEMEELLPSVIEAFGPEHPAALDAGCAHAGAVGRAGDPDTARSLLKELVDRADTALRPEHPTGLRIRIALACWTLHCGATDQALPLASAARERCETLLGSDHPLSINAAEAEALCRFEQTDKRAALVAFSDILSRRWRCFGPEHPHALQTASNHAAVLCAVQGPAAVIGRFADLDEQFGRVLGNEHPETLRVRVNLALATLSTRGPRAARPLCLGAVDSLSKVLGNDHPDTVSARELLQTIELRIRNEDDASPFSTPPYRTFSGGSGDGSLSDRALKCRITPVSWPSASQAGERDAAPHGGGPAPASPETDGFAILRAVASMPVSTWSYQGEEHVRHLGPMAQDWHAALGVGPDDRTIHLVDANGVSIVAVQALLRLVETLQAEVRELRERLDGTCHPDPPHRTDPR